MLCLLRREDDATARARCRRHGLAWRDGIRLDSVLWVDGLDAAAALARLGEAWVEAPDLPRGAWSVEDARSGAPLLAWARRRLGAAVRGAGSVISGVDPDESLVVHAPPSPPAAADVELPALIPVRGKSGLLLNRAARGYGLDAQDLLHVQEYFRLQGREPNIIELAWIADAWREERCRRSLEATVRLDGDEIPTVGETLVRPQRSVRRGGAVVRARVLGPARDPLRPAPTPSAADARAIAASALIPDAAPAALTGIVALGADADADLSLALADGLPALAFAAGVHRGLPEFGGGSSGEAVLWVQGPAAILAAIGAGRVTAAAELGDGVRHAATEIGASTGLILDLDAFPFADAADGAARRWPGSALLTVHPDHLAEIGAIIDHQGGTWTIVGELPEDGEVELRAGGRPVAALVAGLPRWGWPRRDRAANAPPAAPAMDVHTRALDGGQLAAAAPTPVAAPATAAALVATLAGSGARSAAFALTWGSVDEPGSLGALTVTLRAIGEHCRAAGIRVTDLTLTTGLWRADAEGGRQPVAVIAALAVP